jgi:hypothetical protein
MDNQEQNKTPFKSSVELTPEPLKINFVVDFIEANFEEIKNKLSKRYIDELELVPTWFNYHVDQKFDKKTKSYQMSWTFHLARADKNRPEFFRSGSLKIFGNYADTIEEAINKIADEFLTQPTNEEPNANLEQ